MMLGEDRDEDVVTYEEHGFSISQAETNPTSNNNSSNNNSSNNNNSIHPRFSLDVGHPLFDTISPKSIFRYRKRKEMNVEEANEENKLGDHLDEIQKSLESFPTLVPPNPPSPQAKAVVSSVVDDDNSESDYNIFPSTYIPPPTAKVPSLSGQVCDQGNQVNSSFSVPTGVPDKKLRLQRLGNDDLLGRPSHWLPTPKPKLTTSKTPKGKLTIKRSGVSSFSNLKPTQSSQLPLVTTLTMTQPPAPASTSSHSMGASTNVTFQPAWLPKPSEERTNDHLRNQQQMQQTPDDCIQEETSSTQQEQQQQQQQQAIMLQTPTQSFFSLNNADSSMMLVGASASSLNKRLTYELLDDKLKTSPHPSSANSASKAAKPGTLKYKYQRCMRNMDADEVKFSNATQLNYSIAHMSHKLNLPLDAVMLSNDPLDPCNKAKLWVEIRVLCELKSQWESDTGPFKIFIGYVETVVQKKQNVARKLDWSNASGGPFTANISEDHLNNNNNSNNGISSTILDVTAAGNNVDSHCNGVHANASGTATSKVFVAKTYVFVMVKKSACQGNLRQIKMHSLVRFYDPVLWTFSSRLGSQTQSHTQTQNQTQASTLSQLTNVTFQAEHEKSLLNLLKVMQRDPSNQVNIIQSWRSHEMLHVAQTDRSLNNNSNRNASVSTPTESQEVGWYSDPSNLTTQISSCLVNTCLWELLNDTD